MTDDPRGWAARVRVIVAGQESKPDRLLPVLRAMQQEFGHVPREAVAEIATALNLSRAEVHGTLSFYQDLSEEPRGRHVLRLCRAEACQAMGAAGLAEAALARHGLAWGETAADGSLTVEPAYCLGLCSCSPSALFDEEPVGRLDAATLDRLFAGAAAS
ncbi:MAG: NAD(P)H-dependent oxidoreductase subunit E [Rhodospirillales bacterium]|nr:NAD(P)H-dependent oxidoreductase subunit E [Rhodospirillales bacterium]